MDDKTTQLLTDLATKLGTTAEYLWGVLVRQAYVNFWANVAYDVITIIAVCLTYKLITKAISYFSNLNDDDEPKLVAHMIVTVLVGIVTIILTIASLCNFDDMMTSILNPEYWALHQILHLR